MNNKSLNPEHEQRSGRVTGTLEATEDVTISEMPPPEQKKLLANASSDVSIAEQVTP